MAREGPVGREGYMVVDAQNYSSGYGNIHKN